MEKSAIIESLSKLNLSPFDVSIDATEVKIEGHPVDAIITLAWNGEQERFAVEFKRVRALRDLHSAIQQAQLMATLSGAYPLVVVPYLNSTYLDFLQTQEISGLDLCGNGYITVPGKWWFRQSGYENTHKVKQRSPRRYSGVSSLVGRVLLMQRGYTSVNNIHQEILRRGGNISLSQVSKVLRGMKDDLLITRTSKKIEVLQPTKLLDALVEEYVPPNIVSTIGIKGGADSSMLSTLREQGEKFGIQLAAASPSLYTFVPEARKQLRIYSQVPIPESFFAPLDVVSDRRFADIQIQGTTDPLVFFDLQQGEYFPSCSQIQIYLELMQGGKREKEIAEVLRADILATGDQ